MKKGKKSSAHRQVRFKNTVSPPARKIASKKIKGQPKILAAKAAASRKISFLPSAQGKWTPAASASFTRSDLPFSYDETKLILLVRDTTWAYSYWDFSSGTWQWVESFCRRDRGSRPKLRVHNLDQGNFFDLDVDLNAKNWYIDLGSSNTSFEAELGLVDSSGKFHAIAKSNRIRTPRSGPSEVIDTDWEPSDFDEIYRLSGGGKKGHGSEIFSTFKKFHHRPHRNIPLKGLLS